MVNRAPYTLLGQCGAIADVLNEARMRRFLENGDATDVRIISASNRDLLRRPSDQPFCADLYYRLNVAHLQIPALRERREDISYLMGYYLKMLSAQAELPLCELDA